MSPPNPVIAPFQFQTPVAGPEESVEPDLESWYWDASNCLVGEHLDTDLSLVAEFLNQAPVVIRDHATSLDPARNGGESNPQSAAILYLILQAFLVGAQYALEQADEDSPCSKVSPGAISGLCR